VIERKRLETTDLDKRVRQGFLSLLLYVISWVGVFAEPASACAFF